MEAELIGLPGTSSEMHAAMNAPIADLALAVEHGSSERAREAGRRSIAAVVILRHEVVRLHSLISIMGKK